MPIIYQVNYNKFMVPNTIISYPSFLIPISSVDLTRIEQSMKFF